MKAPRLVVRYAFVRGCVFCFLKNSPFPNFRKNYTFLSFNVSYITVEQYAWKLD